MGYHHPCPSLKILNVHLAGSTTILYAFTPDLIISVWNKPWRGSSFIYSKASMCYPPPYSVWTILKTLKYGGGGRIMATPSYFVVSWSVMIKFTIKPILTIFELFPRQSNMHPHNKRVVMATNQATHMNKPCIFGCTLNSLKV